MELQAPRFSIHQLKEYFLYLIYELPADYFSTLNTFYCKCYFNVLYVLKNDSCKLYNTICTSEEEWITRNKYSFGVKTSCSDQSSFSWSTCLALHNPLYSLSCSYANTVRWGRGGAKTSFHLPGFLNAWEVLRDGLTDLPSPCFDNWLMRRGVQVDLGQGLATTVGMALWLCLHTSWTQGGLQWIAVTHFN